MGAVARAVVARAVVKAERAVMACKMATYRVAYCHDAERPGVETDHAFHRLFAESYAVNEGSPVWSWALLAPDEPVIAGESQGTRGCVWPGCPGSSMRFSPTRLLQHARHAHGGQIDDARLRWAAGLRCGTCAQPFCASGLQQHCRRNPADGVRVSPSQFRSVGTVATITPADEAFGVVPRVVGSKRGQNVRS